MSVIAMMGGDEYAAFVHQAPDLSCGYLTQLRIVSPTALSAVFGIRRESASGELTAQPLNLRALVLRFVEYPKDEWRHGRYPTEQTHSGISGRNALGEDVGYETFEAIPGRNAGEYLGFGLMVENAVHPIYRVWTRTWFAHK